MLLVLESVFVLDVGVANKGGPTKNAGRLYLKDELATMSFKLPKHIVGGF